MDKYEYNLKYDQIKSLCAEESYESAAEIADSINWNKVKNANALVKVGEVYENVGRLEDARDILLMAYDRSPIGRMIIYRLAEVAIKMEDYESALEYYEEFVKIAPHDTLKYVLKYNIKKAQGAPYEELIPILEEFKDQEYMEEWAYELAYLYHKCSMVDRCIEACDELILWFGDGPYVERALELKMLYQPLNKMQEKKYRRFKMEREKIENYGWDKSLLEEEEAAETQVEVPPIVEDTSEKLDTVNIRLDIVRGMQKIKDATDTKVIEDTLSGIRKIVDDIPYLKMVLDEEDNEKSKETKETNKEIDSLLKTNFHELLGEDDDGQMTMMVSGEDYLDDQVSGQMSIQDILDDWEKTRKAAETALHGADQMKLESEKARALEEAGVIMDRLNNVIPKLDAGISPKKLLEDEYLAGTKEEILAESQKIAMRKPAVSKSDSDEASDENVLDKVEMESNDFSDDEPVVKPVVKPEPEEEPENGLMAALHSGIRTVKGNSKRNNFNLVDRLKATVDSDDSEERRTIPGVIPVTASVQGSVAIQEEKIPEELLEDVPLEDALEEETEDKKPEENRKSDAFHQMTEEEVAREELGAIQKNLADAEAELFQRQVSITDFVVDDSDSEEFTEYISLGSDDSVSRVNERIITQVEPEDDVKIYKMGDVFSGTADDFNKAIISGAIGDFEEETEPEEIKVEPEEIKSEEIRLEESPEADMEVNLEEQLGADSVATIREMYAAQENQIPEELREPEEVPEDVSELFAESAGMKLEGYEAEAEYGEVPEMVSAEIPEENPLGDMEEDSQQDDLEPDLLNMDYVSHMDDISRRIDAQMSHVEALVSQAQIDMGIVQKKIEAEPDFEEQIVSQVMMDSEEEEEEKPKAKPKKEEKRGFGTTRVLPFKEVAYYDGAELTKEQKEIFKYFVPIQGMEFQLSKAIEGVTDRLESNSSAISGNLVIVGDKGCGKTELATCFIKALQSNKGNLAGKIGKIDADSLNTSDIKSTLDKIKGGCLIIEKAGELNKNTTKLIGIELAKDFSGTLIILEDSSKKIRRLFGEDRAFSTMFTEKISIPIFTNDELVAFAREYARELGYKIDELAVLALYNRISSIQRLDQATTLSEVKDIVDEAIRREAHGGIKKAISILTAKRYTDDDRIVLTERTFN